jgi:protein O-mannosyl-transferase
MATKKKVIRQEEKLLNWKILFLIAASFLAYYPTLTFEFVHWDDLVYVMGNDMITSVNWINLKKIFSTYFQGNYHPLILISFLYDYHFFKYAASGYHLHNLVLHIVNAVLVYSFFFHLLKKNSNVAVTVALLFALHPMHVESVAWVSERKDVLYTAWYFLSLLSYLFFLQKGRSFYYFLALLFFLFSCLSKAQAVTLPLVLLLIDYMILQKFEWKTIVQKIPFFLLSLIFGIIAVFAQRASSYINPLDIPVFQSLFYAPYSLWVYLMKFLAPVFQTAIYDYPVTLQGTIPWYLYFSPVIFPVLLFAVWKTWKNYKYVTFGILFFLATIFPVLQFLPVGSAVVAERYSYIPYIGLSAIIAIAFWENRSKLKLKNKNILDASAIFILILMIFLTWNRTYAWQNSIALWTDVMKKNPSCMKAYTNRAFLYDENKDFDKALKDLSDGIKVDTNDSKKLNFYLSRAYIYQKTGKYDSAAMDFSSALEKHPENVKPYFDRGILYVDHLAKYDSGIRDFKKFLQYFPTDFNGTINLGVAYYKNNSLDSSKKYLLKSVELNPASGDAHKLLTNVFYQSKDYPAAYRHGMLAKQYGAGIDSSMLVFLKQKSAHNEGARQVSNNMIK